MANSQNENDLNLLEVAAPAQSTSKNAEPISSNKFDASLIKKYPRSTRKVTMHYGTYSLSADIDIATAFSTLNPYALDYPVCDKPLLAKQVIINK